MLFSTFSASQHLMCTAGNAAKMDALGTTPNLLAQRRLVRRACVQSLSSNSCKFKTQPMHATCTELNLLSKFEYPVACTDIKVVHDTEHLVSCGVYKPSVKVHSLSEQTLMVDRNIQNEPLELVLIDGIYKYGILTAGSKIEIHDRAGLRAMAKAPTCSRSITRVAGELLVGSNKSSLTRYNLAKQAIDGAVVTGLDETVKIKAMGPSLVGVCGTDKFSVVDLRSSAVASTIEIGGELLSFDFSENICFVGDEDGCVHVVDLNLQKKVELLISDAPVRTVKCSGDFLMSSSKAGLRVWKNMQSAAEICLENTVNTIESFGPLIFLGLDASKMRTFHISEMGMLPRWCCSA